jgi:hypothetical protein
MMRFVFSVLDDDNEPIVEQTAIPLSFEAEAFALQEAKDAEALAQFPHDSGYDTVRRVVRRTYGRGRVINDICRAAGIVASKVMIEKLLDHFKVP